MLRGLIAVLAVAFLVAPGFGAALEDSNSPGFDVLPALAQMVLNSPHDSAEPATFTLDIDAGRAPNSAARHKRRGRPGLDLDLTGVTGKKTGDLFPYGLVLVVPQVGRPHLPEAEAAELSTMLMIGMGLILLGVCRRYLNAV